MEQSLHDFLFEVVNSNTLAERIAELLPSVHANASEMSGNDENSEDYTSLMQAAIDSIKPIKRKMQHYNSSAIDRTLRTLRACRFFNYNYIAGTSLEDLNDEMEQLYNPVLIYLGTLKMNSDFIRTLLKNIETT